LFESGLELGEYAVGHAMAESSFDVEQHSKEALLGARSKTIPTAAH